MGISAAIATAVVSTAYSQDRADSRADDVRSAEEERAKVQTNQRASQAARARRKTVREAMTARAQVENSAASQGVAGSSAVIQGSAGASAQAGSNVNDINTSVNNQQVLEAANQKVINKQSAGPGLGEQLFSQAGSMAGSAVGGYAAKYGETLFKP
jgi:hypothetical protein